MSFVGYISHRKEHEESIRLEKERWERMTPEEREADKLAEIKVFRLLLKICFFVSIPIIAFIIWVLTY